MSAFKDLVEADREIFINIDELGEAHDIDGTVINVVLEDEQIEELKSKQTQSSPTAVLLSQSDLILFAKTEELPERKTRGEILYIDDVGYTVDTWLDEMGITRITLHEPESW